MKPVLIIGLGNPLMGDDGVGAEIARRLAADPRLPPGVEVIEGGTDLLRCGEQMLGRERVIIVDALLDAGGPAGALQRCDCPENSQSNAHRISAAQAFELLQCAYSALAQVRFTLIGITVSSARLGAQLSPELQNRLPEIAGAVLADLFSARKSSPSGSSTGGSSIRHTRSLAS